MTHAEDMQRLVTIINNLESQIKEMKVMLKNIAEKCPKASECPAKNKNFNFN
jgi:translation initiation factor 1 (eIF-1/SUI1)